MKNIESYNAEKYKDSRYSSVEEGIFQTDDNGEILYVTSLSFVQEPELGEGSNAGCISQYPLEDILDKFYCYISDFYDELNSEKEEVCYQEFASPDLADIVKLRTIIGKHVYNQEVDDRVKLVIE